MIERRINDCCMRVVLLLELDGRFLYQSCVAVWLCLNLVADEIMIAQYPERSAVGREHYEREFWTLKRDRGNNHTIGQHLEELDPVGNVRLVKREPFPVGAEHAQARHRMGVPERRRRGIPDAQVI